MAKRRLLILHGALGATSQFDELIEGLSPKFECHTFNFSGHGGEAFRDDFSIHQFAKELEDFIVSNRLEGIDVFGYSMGGYVALALTARKASLLGKIHTLGTKFHWTPDTAAHEIKMLNPAKIEEKVPKLAQMLIERHQPTDWKEMLKKTRELMIGLGEDPVLSAEAIRSITHEVLIGIGEEDNMVSIEESQRVATELPKGELKLFESFKHPIEQVDINTLTQSLTSFLLR